jgi:hypothetical protein
MGGILTHAPHNWCLHDEAMIRWLAARARWGQWRLFVATRRMHQTFVWRGCCGGWSNGGTRGLSAHANLRDGACSRLPQSNVLCDTAETKPPGLAQA